MADWLAALLTLLLFIFSVTAIVNVLILPRLGRDPAPLPSPAPPVSLLVPARNEAATIERTVRHLLAQTYPHFELIVLDDNSTDATAEILAALQADHPTLRVLAGEPLPAGWLGKNWACHQLGRDATGEILIFTDADVVWQPDALRDVVAAMDQQRADLLSVWPTQTTVTWAERLTVPTMALAILAYLPLLGVHATPWPAFAAANGQCLAFRRDSYTKIGGHSAVADNIVEDVALARLTKRHGGRLRLFDGNRQIGCRMYTDWSSVADGFAKNMLAGHANSLPFLLLSTLFHWGMFVLPWLWLLVDVAVWPLAVGGMLLRMLTAEATQQRKRDALLMPLSVLLMTWIAARSVRWQLSGTRRWKGRPA